MSTWYPAPAIATHDLTDGIPWRWKRHTTAREGFDYFVGASGFIAIDHEWVPAVVETVDVRTVTWAIAPAQGL